ncbi:Alpha carbonic anhydrase [Macleaya cordata]|uniref:Alpha carbonic anhydrase n=1 Tax=Macleaya cordata TaxID=56857 RepID=A0A200QJ21_MACCD|nr:Alpha carbonic anhydrase [Macleaya cordata]
MESWKITILYMVTILITVSNFRTVTSVGGGDEEYSYIEGSDKGPEHWGELNNKWKACGNGVMQSPIDLLDKEVMVVPSLGMLRKNYKLSPATLVNQGHVIMLNWTDGAGEIYINGTKFFLKQIHWHTPCEHTIDGARYNLEAHLVHQSIDMQI